MTDVQLGKLVSQYIKNNDMASQYISDYIRNKYHGEFYAFRKVVAFEEEKHYNWFILSLGDSTNE